MPDSTNFNSTSPASRLRPSPSNFRRSPAVPGPEPLGGLHERQIAVGAGRAVQRDLDGNRSSPGHGADGWPADRAQITGCRCRTGCHPCAGTYLNPGNGGVLAGPPGAHQQASGIRGSAGRRAIRPGGRSKSNGRVCIGFEGHSDWKMSVFAHGASHLEGQEAESCLTPLQRNEIPRSKLPHRFAV